jgi:hypothetical protein
MKLDLKAFFRAVEEQRYVVIKPSPILPDYNVGSDIDIFCYHPEKFAELITAFLSQYLNAKTEVKIADGIKKMHIDFIIDNEINFRFDLYKCLPSYQNISIKDSFYSSVIEGAVKADFYSDADTDDVSIYVPSIQDDFILRYVEYHEYYAQRPDKIKHIDYIKDKIPKNDMDLALDKLHYFTSFPKPVYIELTFLTKLKNKVNHYLVLIKVAKMQYKKLSAKEFFIKVIKKLR